MVMQLLCMRCQPFFDVVHSIQQEMEILYAILHCLLHFYGREENKITNAINNKYYKLG